jgi:hypothetical protein
MSKLAFRAQTVDIAYLSLRQDLFGKNVLMTAQRNFRLGNSLLPAEPFLQTSSTYLRVFPLIIAFYWFQ